MSRQEHRLGSAGMNQPPGLPGAHYERAEAPDTHFAVAAQAGSDFREQRVDGGVCLRAVAAEPLRDFRLQVRASHGLRVCPAGRRADQRVLLALGRDLGWRRVGEVG